MSTRRNFITPKEPLYHITPMENNRSIIKTGISPHFSKHVEAVCWYCTEPRLAWAIAHVANRHKIIPDGLLVFTAQPGEWYQKTKWDGIYVSNFVVKILKVRYASAVLEEIMSQFEIPPRRLT